jgi:hypothetical protein
MQRKYTKFETLLTQEDHGCVYVLLRCSFSPLAGSRAPAQILSELHWVFLQKMRLENGVHSRPVALSRYQLKIMGHALLFLVFS